MSLSSLTPPQRTTISQFSLHFTTTNNTAKTSLLKHHHLFSPVTSHFHVILRKTQQVNSPCASNFFESRREYRLGAHRSNGAVPTERTNQFNFDSFLSVAELICLVSSAVLSVTLAVKRSVFGAVADRVLVWLVVALVGTVASGTWIRRRQRGKIFHGKLGGSGESVNLVERIDRLEEDLRSSATIIQVLSRQLEKLGIKFRLTRKALKEPIAETAALAQKNSEATRALAVQEDILEKELGEIQKVLLAMQDQQQKQLELILAIGKTSKLWESRQGPIQEDAKESISLPEEGLKQLEINQSKTSIMRKGTD